MLRRANEESRRQHSAITAKHRAVLCERLRERDGSLAQSLLALMTVCAERAAHWLHQPVCAATSVSQSEGGLASRFSHARAAV